MTPRVLLRIYLVLTIAFIFAPVATLALFSFHDGQVSSFPIDKFSTRWYTYVFKNQELREGVSNSLYVGALVSILSTVLGFISAHLLARRRHRRQQTYILLVSYPSLIPLLLSGLALSMYFQYIGLIGSLTAIAVAHVSYTSPFASIVIYHSYNQLNVDIENAASNLGASRLRVLCCVVAPQIWVSLVASSLLCFLISWDEFIVAWFVGGFNKTLPVVIYGMMGGSFNPGLNAAGTLSIVASTSFLAIIFGLFILSRREHWHEKIHH